MIDQLKQNNRAWAKGRLAVDPDFFKRLEAQQKPKYPWIGCSDSRVPANEIVGLAPLEKHSGMVTPLPAEMFNVTPERRDWVNRRCVPQPLATFEMPILLSGRAEAIKQRIFILADEWDPSPFRFFAKKYENATGWQIMKMRCGHSVMVDMPCELAAVLDDLA